MTNDLVPYESSLTDQRDPLDELAPTTMKEESQYLELNSIKNESAILYNKDTLDSFKDFVELASYDKKEITEINSSSSLEDFEQADAELFHAQASRIHLALNKTRNISDVVKCNRVIIDFMYARRELLCKAKSDDYSSGWGKPL